MLSTCTMVMAWVLVVGNKPTAFVFRTARTCQTVVDYGWSKPARCETRAVCVTDEPPPKQARQV